MRERMYVYLILFVAILIRFDFLIASDFRIDSDEAIVGLMARHILETGAVPVFYYGQHYMGSFEPLVAAGSFYLLGANEFALKLVPLLFSIVFIFLVYRLGKALHSAQVGLLAMLLAAIPPSTLIIWSTKARGGFIELLCIGTAALLTTVYWCQRKDERHVYAAFTGLLLGFGWWVNNQIIYYMLPVGFIMLAVSLREKSRPLGNTIRTFCVGMVGFLVGSAPFWLYNVQHDFASFGMFGGAGGTDILEHATGFIVTAVPILLGGKRYWHTEDLFPLAAVSIWCLLLLVLSVVIYRRRRQVLDLFRFSVDDQQPVEMLFLLLFAITTVFIVSSFGYLSQAPRYLLPAYSGILLLFALAVSYLWETRKIPALLLIAAWLALSGMSGYLHGRAIPGEPFVFKQQRVQGDHDELIQWLEAQGYQWVRTNYWIGYRLSFETGERIRFLIFGEPHQTRIASYEQAGAQVGRESMPLILVPAQAEYVQMALDAQGYLYSKTEKSGYVVLYEIRPAQYDLQPVSGVTASVSDRAEFADLAFDGALQTRWRSARHQTAEMFFTVHLPQPTRLRGLRYAMGAWPHDYPRELQIFIERSDGTVEQLYEPDAYLAVRYFLQGDTTLYFYMDYPDTVAVHLRQTGAHPLFDWSIAELTLFQ